MKASESGYEEDTLISMAIDRWTKHNEEPGVIPTQPARDSSTIEHDQVVLRDVSGVLGTYTIADLVAADK